MFSDFLEFNEGGQGMNPVAYHEVLNAFSEAHDLCNDGR